MQAIDKTGTWQEQIDAIWQGFDWHARGDGHWTHSPKARHPPLVVPPSCEALLPYLEADVPMTQIAAALGITLDVAHDRRAALVAAINRQVPAELLPGQRPLEPYARTTSLAQIAMDLGCVWVPLRYASAPLPTLRV